MYHTGMIVNVDRHFKTVYMTFDSLGLDPAILKAIKAKGYTEPSPIQGKAIPQILKGKDVLEPFQSLADNSKAALMLDWDPKGDLPTWIKKYKKDLGL